MSKKFVTMEVSGNKALKKMLDQFTPREARALSKATVRAVASEARKRMRAKAPKSTGTLRKAIVTAVPRRSSPSSPIADVRITHGKGVKNDAFYWRFLEYGTQTIPKQPFVEPTRLEIAPELPRIWREKFGVKLEQKLAKMAKANKK